MGDVMTQPESIIETTRADLQKLLRLIIDDGFWNDPDRAREILMTNVTRIMEHLSPQGERQ